MTTYSYDDRGGSGGGGGGGASVRWNAIALVGRQAAILGFSLVLARILGPDAYGLVAQATVIVTFANLLLDQGLSASLISQRSISSSLVGAASMLNLLLAAVMTLLAWALAVPAARFFNTPELVAVLPVLGLSLLFKGLATVPRMLLTRQLAFRAIAVAEVGSAFVGGVAATVAALSGLDYWSLVVQLVTADVLAAVVFYVAARPPLPNFRLRELGSSMRFGVRVFLGNLVSFTSRNIDNVLVGRFLGTAQLGFYSLAYRILLTPIQLIGQTVSRVLFPAISAARGDRTEVSRLLVKSTRSIALAAFPLMTLVGVAASDAVDLVLGPAWAPAVPVIAVLAVTGARQAVTSTNAPLLLGSDRSDLHLRFNVVAALFQIGGIVAGLPFGIVGVAWGYTIAGFVLTPVIFWLQKLTAGTPYRRQLACLAPPLVGSALAGPAYATLFLVELPPVLRLLLGTLLFGAVFLAAIRLLFPSTWTLARTDVASLLPARRR